jgi:2,3-bisphosphoglycerate-dependent phosphoglycerate mutase
MPVEPHARLILVRHGQSEANAANRFTGWSNPPLTERGREEAAILARRLMDAGVLPDRVFCSALQRSADTARIMLATMAREDVPLVCNLALNERDYGGLAGMNKAEAAERFGAEQVHVRRRARACATPPPACWPITSTPCCRRSCRAATR